AVPVVGEHPQPPSPERQARRHAGVPELWPCAHVEVVLAPRSPPCRPSPHRTEGVEGVAVAEIGVSWCGEVAPGDLHDPVVVAVTLKELTAEGEEALVRQTVVLEDDDLIDAL